MGSSTSTTSTTSLDEAVFVHKSDREKEARHQERRDAGCLNSDTEDEDGADRQLLKKHRAKLEEQPKMEKEANKK